MVSRELTRVPAVIDIQPQTTNMNHLVRESEVGIRMLPLSHCHIALITLFWQLYFSRSGFGRFDLGWSECPHWLSRHGLQCRQARMGFRLCLEEDGSIDGSIEAMDLGRC